MKYQNIHTKEIFKLDHIESVESYPENILVYVFENGECWEEDLVKEHFVEVEE